MDSDIAYENFDLFIGYGPQEGIYRAKVQRSPAGNANIDFVLPFSQEEVANILWEGMGASRNYGSQQASGERPDVEALGRSLFAAVFDGAVGLKLAENQAIAEKSKTGLRIRIQIDPCLPALADLPWEYLATPRGDFLARSSLTPLVRYLEVGCGEALTPVRPPLHVLAVLSNPKDVTRLEVDKEWQRLREVTSPLEERGLLRLKQLENPTPARLRKALRGQVNVLHFVGHGFFDDSLELGGLIFEDENGGSKVVTAKELAELLQDSRTLRLVFLNACEGAVSGRSDSFAGVAQGLVQRCVPAVLAMQFPISDPAAIALSREFYSALADGYPIDAALSEARKAVMEAGGPLEWGTPVLFSRSDDNRLIEMPTGDARPVIERQPWEPETILIEGGTFLMGSDHGEGIPEHETPQREVFLPDYRIGRYPVMNCEYEVFLREAKRSANPEMRWDGNSPFRGEERHPVTGVTWCDAMAYCQWLRDKTGRHYTLPCEAYWEKAARGVDGRLYPWGDWEADRCNQGQWESAPVDKYPPQSTFGCFDMVGNAPEWTSTLWGQSPLEPDPRYRYPWQGDGRDDLRANSQIRRVVRGGAAADPPDKLRCASRTSALPLQPGPFGKRHGFRVMIALEPTGQSVPFCGSE